MHVCESSILGACGHNGTHPPTFDQLNASGPDGALAEASASVRETDAVKSCFFNLLFLQTRPPGQNARAVDEYLSWATSSEKAQRCASFSCVGALPHG
jgi:hypothetical protein